MDDFIDLCPFWCHLIICGYTSNIEDYILEFFWQQMSFRIPKSNHTKRLVLFGVTVRRSLVTRRIQCIPYVLHCTYCSALFSTWMDDTQKRTKLQIMRTDDNLKRKCWSFTVSLHGSEVCMLCLIVPLIYFIYFFDLQMLVSLVCQWFVIIIYRRGNL